MEIRKVMGIPFPQVNWKWIGVGVVAVVLGLGWFFKDQWLPQAKQWLSLATTSSKKKEGGQAEADAHAGHSHAGHDEATSLELSEQARHNIGLTRDNIREIRLATFTRTITIPGMVAERPGRTHVKVVAPLTGIVTDLKIIKGESVKPGTLLFKIRLTHEELVQSQTAFLETLGKLDVENREIARLQKLGDEIIAGKTVLERQYEKQKLEALHSAQRESLMLHGLSEEQVAHITKTRRLLPAVEVFAPGLPGDSGEVHLSYYPSQQPSDTPKRIGTPSSDSLSRPLVVQELNVRKGAFVQAGGNLCVLADLRELYIEGRAFEHDADEIINAAKNGWTLSAVREDNGKKSETIEKLQIVFVNNEIDEKSRALFFYVRLPNHIVHDSTTREGHRFLTWKFKPGQRMQLRIPVEQWSKRIVLPVEAVAQEGAETFVFQQNGDHFDRRPVHVEYRDQFWVVIANDGSLFPGDVVAFTGAHQMQMALKNKAGGGADPHAGHNH